MIAVAAADPPSDRWRVRIPDRYGAYSDAAVHVDVDVADELMTMRLPDGTTTTIDVVTARAVKDSLSAAIFNSLGAPGPWLYAERYDPGNGTWERPGQS